MRNINEFNNSRGGIMEWKMKKTMVQELHNILIN